jgi:thiamine biosynthesis lipoprotein
VNTALAGATALPLAHVEHCMGTAFSIRVLGPGVERTALDAALTWLHTMDAMFSTYRSGSEISRINAGTLLLPDASAEVRHVLAECERFKAGTAGYFDARADGTTLDPSGYVKGWAVQHVAEMLAAAGSLNHCVNGGGDVLCAGRPDPGRGWRIGIADPFRAGELLTSVEVTGPVGVATSGLAERGAHILNPHTGETATSTMSVTVVAADLVTADVYATAAAAMGPDLGCDWLAAKPDVRALTVDAGGRLRYVGNWPEHA